VILLLLSLAVQRPSQQPADLLRALDSPDWQVRSSAIHELNDLPVANLPPGFAAKAIALLEREAVDSAPGPKPEGGEGYGEYLIELMEGVVRLRDPRSLRGMALLGVQMSREAQEFVAEQGATVLPFLDEAWRNPNARASVAVTWAYMLTTYSARLSRNDRLEVVRRVLEAHAIDTQSFLFAVDDAQLVIAIPLIEHVATRGEIDIVRDDARRSATRLKATRDSMSPAALLSQLSEALDALCLSACAERATACASLSTTLRGSSADSLVTFARRVDSGFLRRVWSDDERRVLSISARYVATRLH